MRDQSTRNELWERELLRFRDLKALAILEDRL